MSIVKISAIKCLSDNYVWSIVNGNEAYIVDASDARAIVSFLEKNSLELKGIILTHRHYDHIGGLEGVISRYNRVKVYANDKTFNGADIKVKGGDIINIFGYDFEVLSTPGHTDDHMSYYCKSLKILFPGDTIFPFACGRVLDGGSIDDLFLSLSRIKKLPKDTMIYSAHEYTIKNLDFALYLDRDNVKLKIRREKLKNQIKINDGISLPVLLDDELRTNPFLRPLELIDSPIISQKIITEQIVDKSEKELFRVIRQIKDNF